MEVCDEEQAREEPREVSGGTRARTARGAVMTPRPQRVYVAAAASEWRRARAAIDAIREAGHIVAHDWTRDEEQWQLHGLGGECAHTRERERRDVAQQRAQSIHACEVFVLLAPIENPNYLGCWIEYGMACADPTTTVVIVGHGYTEYTDLATAQVYTLEEAIAKIAAIG